MKSTLWCVAALAVVFADGVVSQSIDEEISDEIINDRYKRQYYPQGDPFGYPSWYRNRYGGGFGNYYYDDDSWASRLNGFGLGLQALGTLGHVIGSFI